jgi:AraC family transcriptional regulator of adaptative response/methylated-DNA-[protein]-cysteine methyltransferase
MVLSMPKQLAREDVAGVQAPTAQELGARSRDYARVAKALAYLAENYTSQPELTEIAEQAGLSEYHFQRTFTHWVGISPKRFLQYITLAHAKERLRQSTSLLDAALEVGLSGPGRLHDLFITWEAMSPGEYKQRGRGLTIDYGFHPSPFGECLLMTTPRGICGLAFVVKGQREAALEELGAGWEHARLRQDQHATHTTAENIFSRAEGRGRRTPTVRLLLRGTPFQVKVWEALLRVPVGALTSYEHLSRALGYRGRGNQAIGQAVGSNAIAYLIPCHRVIRKSGLIGGYRWGPERKLAMLGWEAAQTEHTVAT